MTPERIEELADHCYVDQSIEVSQSLIEIAIRAAINEALEEAARLFETANGEASDLGRWGQEFDAKVASADIRALKVSAE